MSVIAFTAYAQNATSVYITAGQSNAEGRAPASEKPSYLSRGYKHLKYAFVRGKQDGKFGKFKFGTTFAFCDVVNHYLDQAIGRDFYAIKCTYGGTAITPGQTEEGKPVWYADSSWLAKNKAYADGKSGMSLSLSLTEGFRQCAERTLSKLRGGYDVKAIMWHQGESDGKKPDEYYENFKQMILFMRQQIYAVTGKEKDKTLPFIFGTVPHASRQYNPVIEAAQFKVAQELPNVYIIDLSNVPLKEDVLHFNAQGTEYAGQLYFNKLVELGLVDFSQEKMKSSPIKINFSPDLSEISRRLTIVKPEKANGKAIVICPGGGYAHLAMKHEGTDVAQWLSGLGYTCAVLKYRLPEGNCTVPTDDSRNAIRYLRQHAAELNIDSRKVGIMGFSAGGHLAASTAVLSDSLSRPDFQILMYPVISMQGSITHWGSRNNLLGKDAPQLLVDRYSAENGVNASTPPAIMILSADDGAVNPDNSINYFRRLKENKVSASLFIYPRGGHGWGMNDSFEFKKLWMKELESWLGKL